MLDNNHPAFNHPKSNSTLWRYMDLTKLLSLLENQKLFFTRADQFEDPYEGTPTRASIIELRDTNLNGGLPLRVRTTMVNYIDYNTIPIPLGNLFFPFVTKRLSFSYENEVRARIWSQEDINKSQIHPDATSVTVDIVPKELIKAIHVSPTAPMWFGQLVEQLLQRYNLDVQIERSSLYDRPTY